MKYLITFSFIVLMFSKISAQTLPATSDTTLYGRLETNFPGGEAAYNTYIVKNAHYPKPASENNIQGCAFIKLSIEKDGNVDDVKIYSGIGSGMDDEAVKLIKQSGKWLPSKLNGTNVQTKCIVPVNFFFTSGNGNGLKGNVDGNAPDTSYLSSLIAFDSYGISLEEISKYAGKSVKFAARVYGTKIVSDTTFILSCGEYNYPGKYTSILLLGKRAQIDNRKMPLSGYLIKGTGTIVNYNGTFIIVIEDRNQYTLMQAFHKKI